MKFFRYWALCEAPVHAGSDEFQVRAYGGSNEGLDAAIRRAKEVAARTVAAIERGDKPGGYGYADRVLREEIIQEIGDGDEVAALVTRNAYGSLVLNASRVMFIDVDFLPVSLAAILRRLWDALRGKAAASRGERDEAMLRRFHEIVAARPSLGVRIYRTAGGYRLLVTSGTYDPVAVDSVELLKAFGSDKLYVRLCKVQECFRARLSAKYWRCGAKRPPLRYPWIDAAEEARYRKWEEDYHSLANEFATCEYIGSFGEPSVHDDVRPILDTHDRLTMREGARLA